MSNKQPKQLVKKHKQQLNSNEKHKSSKFQQNNMIINHGAPRNQMVFQGQDVKSFNQSSQHLNVDNSNQSLERIAQLMQNSEKVASQLSNVHVKGMTVLENENSIQSMNDKQAKPTNKVTKQMMYNTAGNNSNSTSKKRYASNPKIIKNGQQIKKQIGNNEQWESYDVEPIFKQRLTSSSKRATGGSNALRNSGAYKKQSKSNLKSNFQQNNHLLSLQNLQLQSQIASQSQLFVKDGQNVMISRHGQPPQFTGNFTTTNAIRDSRSAGTTKPGQIVNKSIPNSTMVTLQPDQIQQLQQLRQNSIQSQQSQGTQGSGLNQQDPQIRRRFMAQAQNVPANQSLGSGRFNSKKQNDVQNDERSAERAPYGSSNQVDSIKVISKKLINFRPQSNVADQNKGNYSGEMIDQDNNNVQTTEQEKTSFYVSPNHGNQQKAQLINPNAHNQLSPRKQGTETYGQGAIGGTASQKVVSTQNQGATKAIRGKGPRLISGHPGRRLAPDSNTIQVQQEQSNQYTATTVTNQQIVDSSQPSQGSQGLNWRRQPQAQAFGEANIGKISAFETGQKAVSNGRNLTGVGKGLSGQHQNSNQALKTLPISTLDSQIQPNNFHETLPQQNSVQVGDHQYTAATTARQGKAQGARPGQNLNSASSLNLESGKGQSNGQPSLNVIFHPHPLNNNVAQANINGIDLNSLSSQRAPISTLPSEQVTLDSARPASNKMQMNNRNSRKNLRPLANSKKLQGSQPTGQIYNQQPKQFAPYHTAQINQGTNSNGNLNRQFVQTDGSMPRETGKSFATGGNNAMAQSGYQIGQQQMMSASENYQVQSKGTNITNKNALFKFKKNSQTNRGGYQSQGLEQTQTANATSRRPIMIRKNNFVTQQQPIPQNTNQGGSGNRQMIQQMLPNPQLQNKYINVAPKQAKANKPQAAQSSSQGKERKFFNLPGQSSRGEMSITNASQQPYAIGQGFQPSQTVAFGGVARLSKEEEYNFGSGQDSIKSQSQVAKLPVTLTRQDESKEMIPAFAQQPHTARIGQAGGDILNPRIAEKAQNESLQTTMLGSLTQNHISKGNQFQSSVGELQTTSLISLQGGPKLIKVNKSKKMLDTARRSRIQQLDNQETTQGGNTGISALNLVAMNSNGAPQLPPGFVGAGGQPQGYTTKAAQGKQLIGISAPAKTIQNSGRHPQQQQKKFGALIQTQQLASASIRSSLENDDKPKTLQLNVNISAQNEPKPKQAHTQKNQNTKKIQKGNSQLDQSELQVQVKTARIASSNKNETGSQLERASKVGDNTGTKPLRRGQIFKKQMKNSETNSIDKLHTVNTLQNVQSIPNLQVIKTIIETKQGNEETYGAKNEFAQPRNPAVKVENQLSLNLSGNLPTDGTPEEQQRIIAKFSDLQQNTQGMTPIRKNSQESKTETQKMSILNEISEEGTAIQDNYQTSQVQTNPVQKVLKIQNKPTDHRGTAADTNSNRKQTTDSMQRTNINNSTQNVPRGLINTAFSLSSIASRDEVPPLPTTPQNILRYYIHELTDYEKGEILDYDTIYFLGKDRSKKVDGKNQAEKKDSNMDVDKDNSSKSSSQQKDGKDKKEEFTHNYGYDDDKGDYQIVTGDHIGFRYEIQEFLGKGSFGTALRCYDHKDKRELAVKIVKNKKKYYYQASVELKILQYLRQHDTEDIMNVIHIEDYVVFRKHLCMAFELLSMNLFEFLKVNDFNGFDHNLIRRFAIQLLYALKYLKQLEIIHCDLKPENILLKEENKSGIKIIDFGSSTFIDEKVYTYIQSRFYRAPEIMLGVPYTPAIDMWSLGCIMAELYIGYPLFPGESENDQMSRVMEMRDIPPGDVLQVSERKMKFFTVNKDTRVLEPIMLKNSRGKLRKANGKPLDYVIGDEDPDFNDFVAKCLDWNPETRLTPDQALKHVWVLKGLPPQVLIHHQKMHNIGTPELPPSVKVARDEFLQEQQREQELVQQQSTQRKSREKQRAQGQKSQEAGREISLNPNAGRPQIQLKTPRAVGQANGNQVDPKVVQAQRHLNTDSAESKGTSQERAQPKNTANVSGYPGTTKNAQQSSIGQTKINFAQTTKLNSKADGPAQQPQGNTRRKFVIKKINKAEQQ